MGSDKKETITGIKKASLVCHYREGRETEAEEEKLGELGSVKTSKDSTSCADSQTFLSSGDVKTTGPPKKNTS